MAADPSVGHHVEVGIRALIEGDVPRAIGAFASIDRKDWDELADRFPGFPAQLGNGNIAAIAHGRPNLLIENHVAVPDDEPDWTALGSRP